MTTLPTSDGLPPPIGRQHELSLLWDAVQTAARARLAWTLLAGEPGIGKTRLLDAAADRAVRAGAAVLRGGALDAEGMPPYLPFLEALGSRVRATPPDALRAQTGPLGAVLATILPELADRLGTLAGDVSTAGGASATAPL